jgi:hypothetical protein
MRKKKKKKRNRNRNGKRRSFRPPLNVGRRRDAGARYGAGVVGADGDVVGAGAVVGDGEGARIVLQGARAPVGSRAAAPWM